jgi:DNA-binding MarR family transcriptional regulator
VDDTPWLDAEEQQAWRGLVMASNRLLGVLDAELTAQSGLAFGDYEVLVVLSEAPDRRMRMSELAEHLCLSPSGLTRRLDRLTRDGLVAREQCRDDKRGSFAVLSPAGFARLEQAAPGHVGSVRRHFLDRLDRHQIRVVGEALKAVSESCPSRASVVAGPATV